MEQILEGEEYDYFNYTNTMNFGSSYNEAPRQQPSFTHPFVKYLIKDEQQRVTLEEVEATTQDPDVASFVDEIVPLKPQIFLAKLLHEGAKLPHGFYFNTLQ